jgi:hypothetical protein
MNTSDICSRTAFLLLHNVIRMRSFAVTWSCNKAWMAVERAKCLIVRLTVSIRLVGWLGHGDPRDNDSGTGLTFEEEILGFLLLVIYRCWTFGVER